MKFEIAERVAEHEHGCLSSQAFPKAVWIKYPNRQRGAFILHVDPIEAHLTNQPISLDHPALG